ncbi:MAG: GNAT family N-acetyltransferase [Thermodesulfovibrionales bacterium]
MIKELTWDSNFFRKKIGEIILSEVAFFNIKDLLDKAKAEGFHYITCRYEQLDIALIKLLTSNGFYLTDIGVIWNINVEKFVPRSNKELKNAIIKAEPSHIPALKQMSSSLYPDSRFYNDPFFNKEDAERLFMAWIENSVIGDAADVVFYYPEKGYITCKKQEVIGKIVLVGVAKQWQQKGIGRALVGKALDWFYREGIKSVQVRTQLKNINAMNFYSGLGFRIQSIDLIFGNILI